MELLLIRHGEATAVGNDGVMSDHDRDLTEAGVGKIRRAARAIDRMEVRLNAIISSPYPRAEHTARIICDGLTHKPVLRCSESLAPGNSVTEALAELRQNGELRALAICGHEPTLSMLANRLLGNRNRPVLIFHTGSVAYLQLDLSPKSAAGTLHWFLDSRQLDMIGQAS